jgi:DNA modification methylase
VTDAYRQFLEQKIKLDHATGFDVAPKQITTLYPQLKPHQAAIVRWAVQGGCRAIFASFGLGKTFMQLATVDLIQVNLPEGQPSLITVPLGVRQEFRIDAEKLDIDVQFIRTDAEVDPGYPGIYLTNYESIREGKINPGQFAVASLDEASILRSFGSKTYQEFLPLFRDVRFKFVATATPSPNRFKELIHYAGFLGIMDTGQALTRFFQRDSQKAGNLTLYPHKEREFWLWLNSWAIFLQRPSDLGFSDEGYVLPELDVRYHEVAVSHADAGADRDGQARLFRNSALGLSEASREKRDTMPARIAKMVDLVQADPDDHFILWHDLEDERRAIEQALPAAVSVYGTQDLDFREERIIDFSEGRFQYLSTKPVIAGSGCNFQRHCHREVFVGIGFKFNDFIQAVHRVHRFLQVERVRIDIIYAESEREVLRTLQAKWTQHNLMVETMTAIIREHGLNHLSMAESLRRSIGIERIEARGDNWIAANNDCVEETRLMDSNSVDLIVTSVPFANHYEYTPSYNDFGHTDNNAHFWAQMDHLTPQLLRILRPGRVYACHVKDRINFGNVTGAGIPTVSPFHMEAAMHAMQHGFDYMGMITVVTDVVRENNQTYRLGWTEQCKDGSKMGVGSPEYILLLHKPQTDRSRGYADTPVVKDKATYTRARWQTDAHAFWRSSGNRLLTAEEMAALPADVRSKAFTDFTLAEIYDYETHVRIGEELEAKGALPATFMCLAPGSHDPNVWHDVNRMRTLNSDQNQKGWEKHVCPLQFDIVDRLIRRYSNEGETVFDPFGGLMTVPYRALHLNRKGRAAELNPGYFFDGVKYLEAKEREKAMPTLFDFAADDLGRAA